MSTAPGAPGIPSTWCSSAKDMVGCALGGSRLWFTIGGGIVNEVYYPRVDIPQIRDLGFLVGDGAGFWVEVKRLWRYTVELAAPGAPAVRIVHRHERFELTLRVAPCEHRDVLLVEVTLSGDESLKPYALLAPHLGGTGKDNRAQVADYRGRRLLWAEQGPFALALAAVTAQQQDALGRASAGFVGASDGWQDFARNGGLSWQYDSAGPGNVALVGELPRQAVLGLGFGSSPESAATLALTALSEPFAISWERQLIGWTRWHTQCGHEVLCGELPAECAEQVRISTMALRVHQDKTYPGAMVASLSVPWGNTHEEREGYHLVWPRDLVECSGALLAVGAVREARNTLRYLLATQHADGHWNQNQWLGGKGYWEGLQLDETAFPVLLAVALDERNALEGTQVHDMIRGALSFLVRNGPVSQQDRWEENAGLNTSRSRSASRRSSGAHAICPPRGASWHSPSRTSGMRAWRTGPRWAGTHRSHGSTTCRAITCALRPSRPSSVIIPRACCRSATCSGIRACQSAPRWASTSCSWCASVCAARTIRSSSRP